ncbi:MAG: glutaredoxin family protein [Bacteroidota bacterium]
MTVVELFSKEDCKLCDDARNLLKRLDKEFVFKLEETKLTEDDPRFKEFMLEIPVVVVNGKSTLKSVIREEELRTILKGENPSTKLFHFAKFLEALGFLTVAVGLMYGVMGNMWIDLYFFLAGVLVFVVGRRIEKREMKQSG